MGRLFNETDGFDEDNCLSMYDSSYDFYKLVLESFLKDAVRTLQGMKDTYAAEDVENYRILVHGLKGAGGSAGATHLVELATESNALIREGKWEEARAYHEPLVAELTRVINVIPERIAAFAE